MKSVRPAPPANNASPVKRCWSTRIATESGVWPGASRIWTLVWPSANVAPSLIRRLGPFSFEATCARTVAPVRWASRRTPDEVVGVRVRVEDVGEARVVGGQRLLEPIDEVEPWIDRDGRAARLVHDEIAKAAVAVSPECLDRQGRG